MPEFSDIGRKLSAKSGILELMDDLGMAMTTRPDMRMLGGGNPAAIPEMQAVWRERIGELTASGEIDRVLVNYDPPQGSPAFCRAIACALREEFGWDLTEKNVAITTGGQTAFFYLFNLLAGEREGKRRRILIPLMPEYIGYANQGMSDDLFTSQPAFVEETGPHEFKYHVDFDNLEVGDDIAAICASRPTNPSGNTLTDVEVKKLAALAEQNGIPLILDNAYGLPFPGAIFSKATPVWNERIILTLSLSKIGLPGTRTGIVIASEEICRALASMTAVTGLANNNLGQAIARPLVESRELFRLSREVVRPFYEERSVRARKIAQEAFGEEVPWAIHRSEGAFFLWIRFPGLPVSTMELYRRLKERGVLVIPGEYFFFGLPEDEDWAHPHECIRVTFSQSEDVVREGIGIIADEVRTIFGAQ
ncbi:MAG: valine--pyruvate transaminase [Verrucomicrobiota bacterium]